MRLFVLTLLVGGLFISGYAQVANNVEKSTRYRVVQDNIMTVSESQTSSITSEQNLNEAISVDLRSNSQLDELGSRYGWTRSGSQLDELGSRYGWTRSGSQLDELGSRYGWTR
ncbi:MAG: hypothetical protein P8X91_06440 [Candidatus Bathyarchaeota archaeon]